MKNLNPFLQGDHARYVGGKTFLNDEGNGNSLNGKIGEVVGQVQNSNGIIVDFGGTAYVIDPGNLQHAAYNDSDDKRTRALERKWRTSEDKKSKSKDGAK